MTTSAMARPENTVVQGAVATWAAPSAIMLPQEGRGGGTPIPRYERPASSSTTLPSPSAEETMIGAAAFGST